MLTSAGMKKWKNRCSKRLWASRVFHGDELANYIFNRQDARLFSHFLAS